MAVLQGCRITFRKILTPTVPLYMVLCHFWLQSLPFFGSKFWHDNATYLNCTKFMKSGWRLESGIEPWVCIYGQKMSHNYWAIYRNSDHSDAIVRRFFWRSVSTRGLFNIELRLRPRQSRPLVCRPLFLFSRPQRLLRPLAEPVGRSRCVQQTLPPPPPRGMPPPAVSAAPTATAPPASVLKTPLPEVALASLDFTSFSFVWHCFSFNAKFSIVEDVE